MVTPKFPIEISEEQIVQFCQRHHIQKLCLLGLVLRDDITPVESYHVR